MILVDMKDNEKEHQPQFVEPNIRTKEGSSTGNNPLSLLDVVHDAPPQYDSLNKSGSFR